MEVVDEGVTMSNNVEYEMMQDAIPILNEDQPMEYAAAGPSSSNIHEQDYEVMMEEYGHEGDSNQIEEGEMEDAATATMEEGEEERTEAEMVDEQHPEESHVEEVLPCSEQGEDAKKLPTSGKEAENIEGTETYEGNTVETSIGGVSHVEEEEHAESIVEGGAEEEHEDAGEIQQQTEVAPLAAVVPQEQTEKNPEEDAATQYNEAQVQEDPAYGTITDAEEHGNATEEGEAETREGAEAEEEEDETQAPPPVRVTFNGQDFILFPHSEEAKYIASHQEEPISAPQLKAEARIFDETLDVLFESFRVKDSLGDFLEDGSELQINFVDLEMTLREDDVYAREVTLNDIYRIHLGYGLTSSLHLTVLEVPRFITRYNQLAAHVSTALNPDGSNEEGKGEEVQNAPEEQQEVQIEAVQWHEGEGGEGEEETVEEGTYNQSENGEQGKNKEEGEHDEEHADVPEETYAEEEDRVEEEEEEEEKTGEEYEVNETGDQDEETFVTVGETNVEEEDQEGDVEQEESYEEEQDGHEEEEEGEDDREDIVDYDEAYEIIDDGKAEANEDGKEISKEKDDVNAEYEEGEEEEGGEEVIVHETGTESSTRQKRSYSNGEREGGEEDDGDEVDPDETESKRAKVDDET